MPVKKQDHIFLLYKGSHSNWNSSISRQHETPCERMNSVSSLWLSVWKSASRLPSQCVLLPLSSGSSSGSDLVRSLQQKTSRFSTMTCRENESEASLIFLRFQRVLFSIFLQQQSYTTKVHNVDSRHLPSQRVFSGFFSHNSSSCINMYVLPITARTRPLLRSRT